MQRLPGGSSSAVHAVDAAGVAGQRHRFVLRRYVRPEWRRPALPEREARVLNLLRNANVPAPELVATDTTGSFCDVPALLMTRLPGRLDLRPRDMASWLAALAAPLPAVHGVNVPAGTLPPYRPYHDLRRLNVPAWSARPDAWRRVLDLAAGRRPRAPRVFIHRDYHPANVLWSRRRVSGIVDWVNACLGPAAIDIAHCRRNLAALFGIDAADRFLDHALSATGASAWHPYWDAVALADSGLLSDPRVFPGWERGAPPGLTAARVRARTDAFAVAIAAQC